MMTPRCETNITGTKIVSASGRRSGGPASRDSAVLLPLQRRIASSGPENHRAPEVDALPARQASGVGAALSRALHAAIPPDLPELDVFLTDQHPIE